VPQRIGAGVSAVDATSPPRTDGSHQLLTFGR
jgi:hypothetical protein